MRPKLRYEIVAGWTPTLLALVCFACTSVSYTILYLSEILSVLLFPLCFSRQGAKSLCFRVPGAFEVKQASGKVVPVPDDKTLMCARKHGGVPCCSGEWRTDSTRVVRTMKIGFPHTLG
jgi:hypothetical protein